MKHTLNIELRSKSFLSSTLVLRRLVIMFLWTNFFLFSIILSLFSDGPAAQQCISMNGSLFDACTVAGYNSTFAIPYELRKDVKDWAPRVLSFLLDEYSNKNNCSVAYIGEMIQCSIYAPRCTEGNPEPNLPCRRVCSEFMKRCHEDIDPFWLEYFVGYCTLLPNKTASSGECFEPQGFEKYYNASTTGLLEDTCNRLIFPWCQGIGYHHTILKESTQISTFIDFYGKNYTNDSTKDAVGVKDSEINFWDEILVNHSECAQDIKKMLCSDYFPPCFPNEGLSFYTVCKPICERISQKCPETEQIKSLGVFFKSCETKALGESSHGYCRYTKWPEPMAWLHPFRDHRPKVPPNPSSKGLSTPVIVAIVIVPLIVIGIGVLSVLLWRQRKLPWFHRFLTRADDAKGFVKDEE